MLENGLGQEGEYPRGGKANESRLILAVTFCFPGAFVLPCCSFCALPEKPDMVSFVFLEHRCTTMNYS